MIQRDNKIALVLILPKPLVAEVAHLPHSLKIATVRLRYLSAPFTATLALMAQGERGYEVADTSVALERPAAPTREWRNGRVAALLATTALVAVTALVPSAAQAVDATWLNPATIAGPIPGTFDYSAPANWTPATVPTGGTAFFNVSSTTALSFSTDATVGGWTFKAGASAYTFANDQTIAFFGVGIVIIGGSATIINNSHLNFNNSSTAGNATINNANFGTMNFNNSSTAGSATITNNNNVFFENTSTAENATITNDHNIFFSGNSTAGNAAITNTSGALVDFSGSTGPAGDNRLTVGSIAGAGSFQLGNNELTVGGNNLSTEVSGVISGIGGSLVKVGTGTLTLSRTNIYTGPTTVNGGMLAVNGSIAGLKRVTVNAGGTLGGNGTVGNTTINGGTLAPGNSIGTVDRAGQSRVHGGIELHGRSLAYRCRPHQRHGHRDARRRHGQCDLSRPGPMSPSNTPSSTPPAASAAPSQAR